MKDYHTETMFLEIFNIYQMMTEKTSIDLEVLERTFYMFQDIVNNKEEITINREFHEELENLIDTISEFEIVDDELVLNGDITIAFDELFLTYPTITSLDGTLSEYVQNLAIYQCLELPIPLNDTQDIFAINQRITRLYVELAKREVNRKDAKNILFGINLLRHNLEERIENADELTIQKIKMCLAYYNGLYADDVEENFNNSTWKVILFDSRQKLKRLEYDKLEFLTEMLSIDSGDILPTDDEDFEEEIEEDTPEIEIFLSYFLVCLDAYINTFRNSLSKETLEDLIIKKNLLLASSEVETLEQYYLENLTFDNFKFPQITENDFNENTFEIIKGTQMERALSLNYSDEEITKNPYLYSKLVISALFIRCFLELSKNENSKQDIINTLITDNRCYKNKYYSISTNIMDTIIFSKNLSRGK